MASLKFTKDSSSKTSSSNGKVSFTGNLSADADASLNFNVSVENTPYQVVTVQGKPLVQITGGVAFPDGSWILDTDKKTVTREGATSTGTAAGPTGSTAAAPAATINIAGVVSGLDTLVERVTQDIYLGAPDKPPIGNADKQKVKDDAVFFKEGFTENPTAYVGTKIPQGFQEVSIPGSLFNGSTTTAAGVTLGGAPDISVEIAAQNADFKNFLIQGKNGQLTDKLAQLHQNFKAFISYLGVSDEKFNTAVGELESPEFAVTAMAESGGWNFSNAKSQIVKALEELVNRIEKPKGSGTWDTKGLELLVKTTQFNTDDTFNKEMKQFIADIKADKSIAELTTDKRENAADKTLLLKIRADVPPELAKTFRDPQNIDAAALLKAGADGRPTLNGNDKILYENSVKFANYLGLKEQFIAIAKSTGSDEGPKQSVVPDIPSVPGIPEIPGGILGGGSGGESGPGGVLSAVKDAGAAVADVISGAIAGSGGGGAVGEAEAPPPEQVAFYVKITRADPSKGAKIKIYSEAIGRAEGSTEFNYTIPGRSFGKLVPIIITQGSGGNAEFFEQAAKNEQAITIEIEAVPASGGAAITKSEERPVPYPRKRGLKAEVIPFQFDVSLGTVAGPGLQADKGYGGAKNFTDESGQVQEIAWAKAGGVKYSLVNVDVSAVGRTYTFNFETRPFLVPVRLKTKKLDESKKPRLNEATTVPHWIFIDPNRARRGAGGAGGAGGGDDVTAAGEALNIAVKSIQISTDAKWITLPVPNSDWDEGSFKVTLEGGKGANLTGLPAGVKTPLCADDLSDAKLGGLLGMKSELRNAIYNTLFRQSEAYMRLGITCWGDSQKVSGPSALTAREPTSSVSMSA